uniref:Phosphohistidine phosphatase 1 n=1 Tax=Cyanistes caeruleus TaxID=156563 RepID=A0A8C0VIK2_CYACU
MKTGANYLSGVFPSCERSDGGGTINSIGIPLIDTDLNPEMEKLGYECKCLGGGKIEHNSKDKKIRVFGLSTGYGKADHSVTVEILKKEYTDYEITWSDDKK